MIVQRIAKGRISRRQFIQASALATGALILGAYIPLGNRAKAAGAPVPGPFDPNVFLKIDSENRVTLISKHFEMGQGVTTGMATLVAEELGADWSMMRFEFAPNNPALYNNLVFGPVMATGGSTSMIESWLQMRQVGAAARQMLVAAAAARWGVSPSEIVVNNGMVSHGTNQATFGELAEEAMKLGVPEEVELKSPGDWTLIGRHLPRLDSEEKVNGSAQFAFDVRRPGMLVAVLQRPDRFGAKVRSVDDAQTRKVSGVVDVVRVPAGVAVLAENTWAALQGRDALKIEWDYSDAEMRSSSQILDDYRNQIQQDGLVATNRGDAAGGLRSAEKTLEAEYHVPYLAHCPMEPLNCTMELTSDGAEIWSGCQLQSIDTFVASQVLGVAPDKIRIHTLLGGGSFGRRGNPVGDWVVELATIVKAINGRSPVQLVFAREDDVQSGFYRPIALHRIRAGLDPSGNIAGWQHALVTQSIFTGTPFEQGAVHDGVDHSSVEGVADTPYAITNFSVNVHNADSPVPVLWWRSVGHSHTAFVMESMVDEMAHQAGKDPVDYRLGLLVDKPRDQAVVRLAAEKAGWGQSLGSGRGRGFAYHFSFGARVAMVADVTVERESFRVDRILVAVDCGVAINPDNVTAQIEGAIGFALSTLFRNEILLYEGRVAQSNFHDYEPTRIHEMPKVEVHIVKSGESPAGIGEPGVPPIAPAVGNALFAATGRRMRSLPFNLASS